MTQVSTKLLDPISSFEAIARDWSDWAASLPLELSSKLTHLRPTSLPTSGMLVIEPIAGYNWIVDACERADLRGKIEASLGRWLGRPTSFRFERPTVPEVPSRSRQATSTANHEGLDNDPFVKLIVERFEARKVRVDFEEDPAATEA